MNVQKMDEFRSNLLLLLQCGHPEGLPITQLKTEYKQYFNEDIGPEVMLPRNFKNNKQWDTLFHQKELRDDFALFYVGTAVFVKALRRRNSAEMKLIAQLAKHSHLALAKKAEFQCGCCPQMTWTSLSKDSSILEPVVNNQTVIEISHSSHPEDIVVKIEPNQMINNGGGEDEDSSSRGTHVGNDNLYSIVQHATHGNHQNNIYVNGGTIISHDTSSASSNTNDGFMLDHQLRVQEHSSPQGQSLQTFASLLNSSGSGNLGQPTGTDGAGGSVSQPFYTFVLQNGEIKVMQIVSSVGDGQPTNGEAVPATVMTSPNLSISSSSPGPTAKKSGPQKRKASATPPIEIIVDFVCSMPDCGQRFEIKQHLQNHERTCSLKKYPCTFAGCDRRFKNSKQRHAHMTSRHKGTENAFRCTVPNCTAFFKTLDRLKVHESRCRFKYEQFQLMDVEEAINNNNSLASSNQSSVPNMNSSTESIEPQSGSNTALPTLQSATTITENVAVPTLHIATTGGIPIKLEGSNTAALGFSTVDLSLVKSEVLE